MDFHLSPEDEDFRGELRSFLAEQLPADWHQRVEDAPPEEIGTFTRRFTQKLAERRWLAMAWPQQYGGQDAPHMRQLIYNEEMAYRQAPGAFSMGVAWVGPALMLYGTEEQKRRFVPPIASGREIWCTLYSEPGAGSDLAALQTRAERDGDEYVINGQKIWTSGAHTSEWGWLAARTDPDAPKHKGISTFIVPMQSPGVSIRPLVNMANEYVFNEVFFDNVRIPKDYLVGEENRGWYQVAVALDFERSGIQAYAGARRVLERLTEFARQNPQLLRRSPQQRLRLAERVIELQVGVSIAYRIPWMQSRGKIPNYEASMSKLFGSELTQRVARTGVDLLGAYGQLLPGSPYARLRGRLASGYLSSVSATIAAGTSEIQRSIIATRGLGLPRG